MSDLSRLIPLSARVILTPGGDDAGAAYKRLNPGASVRSDGGGPADCIVIDRALTATREPPGLLRRYVQDLAPNGVMVIEIANPAYWREAAIQPERGTFDATSMRRDLGELGLVAADVQAVITDEAAGRAHIEAITPELRDRGIDPGEYAETALPEAFIWRVAREMPDQLIVAGDMLRPVGGVSHLRVVHPLRAMAAEPGVSTYLASSASPPEIPRSETTPKIFILHRPALVGAHGQGIVDGLIGKGWLVVTEFDDHPDFLRGMNNPALLSFHGVHAVQTTTPALAEVLRARNPELGLFPNAIEVLPDIRNFTDPGILTVFFGALNRETDWRPIMGAINAVIAIAGNRLRFQVVHDEGFFQALRTPHKTFTPLCDYDTYLDLLGRSEISLMPLDDTPFNRAKSDLKFIEAGACRVASLASAVVYANSVVHGETGLIFHHPGEFHQHFMNLTAIPDLALRLGRAAREAIIRDRMLAGQVARRVAWYRDLWSRRDALTAALRDRMAQTRAIS